jgi:hypothetical protein
MFRRVFTCGTAARISLVAAMALAASGAAHADRNGRGEGPHCGGLPSHAQLKAALTSARSASNGGFNLDMWGSVVNRDGVVCAVAFTGADRGSQWPGSRVISAQKAYTANAFSLPKLALSTANLYAPTQPGGSLFGLQHSNPVAAAQAYGDKVSPGGVYTGPTDTWRYGGSADPMIGLVIGGVNVFGGGLALYTTGGNKVGGVGVSGDTSCTDHLIAWRVRRILDLDHLGAINGVSGDAQRPDNIVFDVTANPAGGTGVSAGGWGHPACGAANAAAKAIAGALPAVRN